MHVTEIEAGRGRGETRLLEEAFGILVDFPHRGVIEGAESVEAMCRLLGRLVRDLGTDEAALPAAMGEIIARIVDEPVGPITTYAVGAGIVGDHQYRWRGMYLEHAANAGGA